MLATYGQRVAGHLIDIGIPAALFAVAIIAGLMTRNWAIVFLVHGLATIATVAFVVWNCGWYQGRSGQSLGKRVLGIQLIAVDTGQPVGVGRSFGRQVAHLIDGLPLALGYLWPLWDERHQTFADKMCGTLVVQADV
jgi:uncharacterized RDD family membrane protein YckC